MLKVYLIFLPNSEKTIFSFTDGELNDTPDNL